jgi:glycosyltransferase involved in cell wall biosynthesis
MRVQLFTSVPLVPPWDQGDKNLAYMLSRSLPGIQFEMLTTSYRSNPAGENLMAHPVYRSRRPSLFEKAGVYAWLLTRSAADSPDLYHLIYRPTMHSSLLFRLLPEFMRRPTIHTVPATADSRLAHRSLFFADHLIALSRYGKKRLLDLGLERVAYIPTGIDPRPWRLLHGREAAYKARLGLSGNRVVLYPGHYGSGYGVDLILKALPGLALEIPDLTLIFACRIRSDRDLERESDFKAQLERLGLRSRVRFYRTVGDIKPLLGASDVVTLPLEKMRDKLDIPTTLLEALAAAKPIIISDLPPMNEILTTRYTGGKTLPGLLVTPGNVQDFQQSVVEILGNHTRRVGMGQAGVNLVRNNFHIQRVAAKYQNLYEQVSGVEASNHLKRRTSTLSSAAQE